MSRRKGPIGFLVSRFRCNPFATVVLASSAILLLSTLIGFSFVEPYQRLMFYATLPSQLLMGFVQALMFAGIYSYMLRGTGLPFTGSRINAGTANVRLDEIIGLKSAKQEVSEVIGLLKDHVRLRESGGRMLNGILFTGDPGTGKTMMAKAVATECGLPFIGISGAGFVEMYVGVGASRVRDLFKRAREAADEAGGCIVFIDEFDALAKAREYTPYGSMEDNRTINQFLEKMDGVANDSANILVIAATNADVSTLDPAITRPGRFDRHIAFTKPNQQDRIEMLRHYLKGKRIDDDVDFQGLARNLAGSSGADIENLVNEALLISIRRGSDTIGGSDVNSALERLRLGIESKITMTPGERWVVAVHEAGHAVAQGLFLPGSPVLRLSVVPRAASLGVAWCGEDERHVRSRGELRAAIRVLLGGYAAESCLLGDTHDGVSSDLRRATALAESMVTELGMGGYLGVFKDRKSVSDGFGRALDEAVQGLLKECLDEVTACFGTERVRSVMGSVARELMDKEELDSDDVARLLEPIADGTSVVPDRGVGDAHAV